MTQGIRSVISIGVRDPIKEFLKLEITGPLIEILCIRSPFGDETLPKLHFSICWIIANVCSLESEYIESLILNNNLLIVLTNLLPSQMLFTPIFWALANIIVASFQSKLLLIEMGVVYCFTESYKMIREPTLIEKRTASWFLSELLASPSPSYETLRPFFGVLVEFLGVNDEEVAVNVGNALSFVAMDNPEAFSEDLLSKSWKNQPILRILKLLTANNREIYLRYYQILKSLLELPKNHEELLNFDLFEGIRWISSNDQPEIKKGICRMLASVLAGSRGRDYLQKIIDTKGFAPILVDYLIDENPQVNSPSFHPSDHSSVWEAHEEVDQI